MSLRERARDEDVLSVRAAVSLLFLLAFASLLGTIPGGRFLYGSPFFLCLLVFFSAFLIHAVWRQILSLRKGAFVAQGQPLAAVRVETDLTADAARQMAVEVLRSSGFEYPSASLSIHAVKNKLGIWGPLGMHLGLLVVLAGGLATLLGAEVREAEIPEGGSFYLEREKTTLRLEKFSVIRYPGQDRAQQYRSRFLVKGDKKEDRHYENLGVNHPLKIGRTKIFQMRYRFEVPRAEIMVYEDGRPSGSILLEKGKAARVSPDGPELRYEQVLPDFRIGPEGRVFSASPDFRNPALKLFISGEEPRWIFQGLRHAHDKTAVPKRDFSITRLHKVYFSGVRVSNDPGILPAYAGYVLLVFSAFLTSFAIPRFVRVRFEEGAGRAGVCFEGFSRRDTHGLTEEIKRLAQAAAGGGAP